MISFTNEVKEEITQNTYKESQEKNILRSFLLSTLEFNFNTDELSLNIFSSFPFILRFIHNTLSKYYKIEKHFFYSECYFGKIKKYKMSITGDISKIENDLNIFEYCQNDINKQNSIDYLIGFFLSLGSVNSPNSNTYHLEFRIKNDLVFYMVSKSLDINNIKYKTISRNNQKIIYFKKSEIISDFLKTIGAVNSMFKFEDSRIQKDFTNQVNRLNNLDISNIKKTITFSKELEKMIFEIESDKNKFNQLSKNEKIYCEIKKNNPEASLSEIVNIFDEQYNIKITRSGLNHYSRKIKKLYEN